MTARIEELRVLWDRAVERDRPSDALTALRELESLEPEEPRWSQRLGETLRRLNKTKEAEEAFARATERYVEKGFVARAIAMAKLVKQLNPARGDLLASLEPQAAVPPPLPPTARAAGAAPKNKPVVPPPLPARPVMLERAPDSLAHEVRFNDVETSSLDIVLDDVDIELIDDPSKPPAPPPPPPPPPPKAKAKAKAPEEPVPESLPEPAEPSMDRLGAMATFRLFAGLSREALLDLGDAAELVEFVPSAMVMMRNEPAFALYAIIDGTVRITVMGSPEIRLGEGDVIGEGCLLEEGQRQADVRAETPLMALRIDKKQLDVLTHKHEAIGDALFQLLGRRLLMNLMYTSPLFGSFEPKVRLELAQLFEIRRANPGTVLAERGKRGDGLYILLSGHVNATGPGGVRTRVARGTAFGHAALVGATAADTTVTTATEAVLLRLPAAKFSALATHYPPVLAALAETAEEPLPASVLL